MGTADEIGATVGAWTALVRRSELPDHLRLAALTLATYADADGTSIHCGVARFAVDLRCGYSTARRHLATLRTFGLVERVKAGNSYQGKADEYRLTLGADVLLHVAIRTPTEYEAEIAALRDGNSAGERDRRLRSRKESAEPVDNTQALRSRLVSAEPVDSPEALRSLQASAEIEVCAHSDQGLRSLMGELPPSPRTSQTTPTTADDVTIGTVSREGTAGLVDEPAGDPSVRGEGGSSQPNPAGGIDPRYGSPVVIDEFLDLPAVIATMQADPLAELVDHAMVTAHADWEPETVRNVLSVARKPMYGSRSLDQIRRAWPRFAARPDALLHSFPSKGGAWWTE